MSTTELPVKVSTMGQLILQVSMSFLDRHCHGTKLSEEAPAGLQAFMSSSMTSGTALCGCSPGCMTRLHSGNAGEDGRPQDWGLCDPSQGTAAKPYLCIGVTTAKHIEAPMGPRAFAFFLVW